MYRPNWIDALRASQSAQRIITVIAIVVLCALVGLTPVSARAVLTSPRGSGLPGGVSGKSPTTGEPFAGEYKPVLAVISNAPGARPAWNLSEADIVYEMPYWSAGHTDYAALYSDSHPQMAGPIRTARLHIAQLRAEWDCPIVYWGLQPDTYDGVGAFMSTSKTLASMIFDGSKTPASPIFSRAEPPYVRSNPHSAVADISLLASEYYRYTPKVRPFEFEQITAMGEDSAAGISVRYGDGFHPSYIYNEPLGVYERSYNAEPQTDGYTGKRIVAANVIVQRVNISYPSGVGSRPEYELTGEGAADVYVAGRLVRATWSHESLTDPTVFRDEFGEVITLYPGKTFVQVIPATLEYTYTRDDGSVVAAVAE